MPLAAPFDVDGVRVSAYVGCGFKDGDLVASAQAVRDGQAGDPGADDRDLHRDPLASKRLCAKARAGTGRRSQIKPSFSSSSSP